MKTMTCRQLGGACELRFQAETFEEMAKKSKQHGQEMYQKKDAAHLSAMSEMQTLMEDPEKMKEWFEAKRKQFDRLPEDL